MESFLPYISRAISVCGHQFQKSPIGVNLISSLSLSINTQPEIREIRDRKQKGPEWLFVFSIRRKGIRFGRKEIGRPTRKSLITKPGA